jgi:2-phospho-L-lactate guanylyltransferase (CobY/MobA/RfbA family)
MGPAIVIPYRSGSAKSRLPAGARERIAEAMMRDVLAACDEVGRPILADGVGGQGAAVAAVLAGLPDEPVLVVNSDLPCATPRDVLSLLGAIPEGGLALVAAADGTTNALALASPTIFRPVYGPGSSERFAALAASRSLEIPNLADDVDTLADLERVSGRLGPHTRAARFEAA